MQDDNFLEKNHGFVGQDLDFLMISCFSSQYLSRVSVFEAGKSTECFTFSYFFCWGIPGKSSPKPLQGPNTSPDSTDHSFGGTEINRRYNVNSLYLMGGDQI